MKLLGVGSNAKTIKSDSGGEYLTAIMYLAPAREHGTDSKMTMCPSSTEGCEEGCLYTAGRGNMANVKRARVSKSSLFIADRKAFLSQLHTEIAAFEKKCIKKNVQPVVRLNGTSDLPWESFSQSLIEAFPSTQYYDYTKTWKRSHKLPVNYHLTLSRGENTPDSHVDKAVKSGHNVAVVFRDVILPTTWRGHRVIDGDVNDLRFLDPKGVIVGLRAKGDAKKDTSGFVI
jgi:hypothetical protein